MNITPEILFNRLATLRTRLDGEAKNVTNLIGKARPSSLETTAESLALEAATLAVALGKMDSVGDLANTLVQQALALQNQATESWKFRLSEHKVHARDNDVYQETSAVVAELIGVFRGLGLHSSP